MNRNNKNRQEKPQMKPNKKIRVFNRIWRYFHNTSKSTFLIIPKKFGSIELESLNTKTNPEASYPD